MKFSPLKKVIIILLLTLSAIYVILPSKIPVKIHFGEFDIDKTFTRPGLDISTSRFSINKDFELILGLDLAGGSHLVFEAKVGSLPDAERKSALESLRNVIERRVNLFGISEPNVQSSSFEGKNRIIVELPGVKDTKEAVNLIGQTAQLVFVEIGTGEEPSFGVQTDLTGADLKKATVIFDKNTGKPVVQLEFIQEGAEKFANITERNVGKPLPIYLDNVPISTPVVQEKITGGSAIISGDFTLNEAKNLTVQLNAGALPVPIELVEQRTVGATLGAESVEKSITAGLVGLLMVLIFMVFAYGKLGMVADLALIIFGILTLAL